MDRDGRLAKRAADGLICRLLVLGLSLSCAGLVTGFAFRLAQQPVPFGDWIWAGLLLWLSFGIAQVLAERRVDSTNALSRMAQVTTARTLLPMATIVAVDVFVQPGMVHNLIGFLLVGYATGLLVSTWLTALVNHRNDAAQQPPAAGS